MPLSQKKLTVPNAITLVRALAIPWIFFLIWDNPGKYWWIVGIFALTDNIDGLLARLEDKGRTFRKLGFRRSEPGRKLDPIIDKLFIAVVLVAGLLHGVIPLWLGLLSLAQKAVATLTAFKAESRRANLQVARLGKYGEFITNVGLIALLGLAAFAETSLQRFVRLAAISCALLGVTLAALATFRYAHQASRAKRPQN